MRAHTLGFMNEDPSITPNLDAFADESLVLTQAVSNYPVCSPYRAMLMTGRYPFSNKVIGNCLNITEPFGVELQKSDRCWSDVLKDKGYSLGYIGKWHLEAPRPPYIDCANNKGDNKWNEWCPPERRHGFDYWYSYNTYDYHNRPLYWKGDAGRNEFHYVDQWGPEHEADLAIKYIRNEGGAYRKEGKPFALVVSMNPPHTPYNLVPKKYVDMYGDVMVEELCNRENIPTAGTRWGDYYRKNIKNYLAMVTGVDEQFGRIMSAIRKQDLEQDTIVVFTSDHGNCLGIHGLISKNNRYEESMRIPFMIRYPGRIKPRRDDLLMSVPDLYPTLMELMGFKKDIPADVEGTSYAKQFTSSGGPRPDAQLYMWVNVSDSKYGRRGIRTDRYTFVIVRQKGKEEKVILHDRTKDKYQLKNIAGERPEVVKELKEKLGELLRKTNDPWLSKPL
jgi:arylsulfatase A-like enzyme